MASIFVLSARPQRSGRPRLPEHFHPAEEVLSVIYGKAEIWADGSDIVVVSAGQSVFVPAGRRHKFRNCGHDRLHMQFTLASPIFEATYDDGKVSRRWMGDQGKE